MTITIFIIFLFIGLILVKILLLRFLKNKPWGKTQPASHPHKTTLAFDRYSVKFLVLITLTSTALLVLAASIQYSYSKIVIHPLAIILFLCIWATGYAYFLRKEPDSPDHNRVLPSDPASPSEEI